MLVVAAHPLALFKGDGNYILFDVSLYSWSFFGARNIFLVVIFLQQTIYWENNAVQADKVLSLKVVEEKNWFLLEWKLAGVVAFTHVLFYHSSE